MTIFTGLATLCGSNEKKSTVKWILQDITDVDLPTEWNTAVTRIQTMATNLAALTNATVCDVTISYTISEDGTIPAAADVFEYGQLVAALNTPAQARKTGLVNVAAPIISMFQTATGVGRDIVDLTYAPLQTYITNLADWVTISDGEIIQVTSGTNGLYSGRRVVRSRRLGN